MNRLFIGFYAAMFAICASAAILLAYQSSQIPTPINNTYVSTSTFNNNNK